VGAYILGVMRGDIITGRDLEKGERRMGDGVG